MGFLSYLWKVIWKDAGKLVRVLYFVAGSWPVTASYYLDLPFWAWAGLSVMSVLGIITIQTTRAAQKLDRRMQPKLKGAYKKDESFNKIVKQSDGFVKIYRLRLTNVGGETIKDGKLRLMCKESISATPTIPGADPVYKFVKQTGDGNPFFSPHGQKESFSLSQGEDIFFDVFFIREWPDGRNWPQLAYFYIANHNNPKGYILKRGRHEVRLKANHETGNALLLKFIITVPKKKFPVSVQLVEEEN